MLLEGRRSLRFTKLEKRSPTMAKVATRAPTSHPSPISAAQMDVANTDTTTPRMVFEGPNMGWPSTKRAPPSSGRPNAVPEELLGDDSRPVGHDQQDQQLQQQRAMHNGAHSDHLKPKFIGGELSRGYGG